MGCRAAYYEAGRWDEALAAWQTTARVSPRRVGVQFSIAKLLILQGKAEAGLEEMKKEASPAWRVIGMPMAYYATGQKAAAEAALGELIAQSETESAYNIAYLYALRGEADEAFDWLDKAVEYKDPGVAEIALEPLFTNLHSDPRWLPFLREIGRAPEQMAAIEFNVTLPE